MDKPKNTLEDYEILNMIGRGAFACVYKAKCKSTGDLVAVKMIEKRVMKSSGMVERVKKEVEIHSRLKHPSILELYAFCEDSNYVYLILELCSRGELYTYINERTTPLSEDQARSIMQEIVAGMRYLHTHAILHRDLSLTNLLLSEDMHVKIADFGLATKLSEPGEQHYTLCGTPNYISPEVASRTAHSLETDLWSLGCMFYTMLVGKPPFDTEGAQPTLQKVIVGEYELPSHVSGPASNLIQSLLQKNPSDRLKLDQVLNHKFFTDATQAEKSAIEDSGYITNESNIVSPVRKVNTAAPADTCQLTADSAAPDADMQDKQAQQPLQQSGEVAMEKVQRDRVERYLATCQHHSINSSCFSSLLSESTDMEGSETSSLSSTGAVACAPVVNPDSGSTAPHPALSKVGSSADSASSKRSPDDLGEPDFTSTPIVERPTKPLNAHNSKAKPVVIAEFELTGKDILRPIREALLKALPAADKKRTSQPPLKGVLEVIQKRCKSFLEKCGTCSVGKQKSRNKEMPNIGNVISQRPALSPLSQNKLIASAGVLCSPPVNNNRLNKEGRGVLNPFRSERLRPIRQRTRNAIVNILDNGDVRLEFLKSRSPTAAITEIFNISRDGTQVSVYRASKGSPPISADLTDTPSPLPPTASQYTNLTLPKKYWKKYLYASRFIKMVKSKTPKVTYFSDQAKCMLMESAEDFEAVFYSGPKFSISSRHVKVIDTTGMNISFETESESSLLSAEVHTMWQHIKMCRDHCMNLEKMLTAAEMSSNSDSSHFPVIIGSRWAAGSTNQPFTVDSSSRQCDFDIQPPTMCSFDGSLMSCASTMNQACRPIRLSPPERHVVLPPYQKSASVTTSDESSQILIRRHVKNVGYASQLRNGAVCVQFDDGYQLTVYAHKSEVTFVYTSGVISRFTEKDDLPEVVRSKLESLSQVISALAAVQPPS